MKHSKFMLFVKLIAVLIIFIHNCPFSQNNDERSDLRKKRIRIKSNSVVFLGLESIAENRFHKTLEERIYLKLSYNDNISLESRDYFTKAKSRGFIKKRLISLNEAVELMKIFGDRIFISGEIRDFKIELKKKFGFLPFGKAYGEIVCYVQVIDAYKKEARFAGNLKYVGYMDLGYIGFNKDTKNITPLSPIEKKHFIFNLIKGMGNTFVETAEGAFVGIVDNESKRKR